MRKIAVIVYGQPGAGKGTQANLLAGKLDAVHFDTGKFLESIWYDPKRRNEAVVKRERKFFETGKLSTPSFVLKEVAKETRRLAEADWSVIYSGSPRTMYEAKGLIPVLERLYGKKNIFIFVIELPERDSIERNSARIVCSVCKAPLLTQYYPSKNPKHCPICGGPFYKRTLDNPKTIKVRLEEYRNRTEPIFGFLRQRGYRLIKVNGRPAPYKVFKNILKNLKLEAKM